MDLFGNLKNKINIMNKEFIPYEQALELKELGFDIPSVSGYSYPDSDNLLTQAILYQQAFRWFREKHGLYSSIIFKKSYPDNHVTGLEWYIIICGGDGVLFDTDGTYTYEEAELACLKKLIEIIKIK
jgi:hypothetical protein